MDCLSYDRSKWISSLRFFLGPKIDDNWYSSLFVPDNGQICGDVSPSYITLGPAGVDHVMRVLPNAKIILLLRNPIERDWSQAKKFLGITEQGLKCVSTYQKLLRFIQKEGQAKRSDYVGAIKRWTKRKYSSQFCVFFYDDISTQPTSVLREVHDFLGVAFDYKAMEKASQTIVYQGPKISMPKEVRDLLVDKNRKQMLELAEMFPGHPERWVESL
jgi:hypothetical protein